MIISLYGCSASDQSTSTTTSGQIIKSEEANPPNPSLVDSESSVNSETQDKGNSNQSIGDQDGPQNRQPNSSEIEVQDVGGVFQFSTIARSMDELIDISDAIVIGTVGEELVREVEDLPHNYSEEELAEIQKSGGVPQLFNIFYNLQIEEVLKGTIEAEIPLHIYGPEEGFALASPTISGGERLLLFLHEDGGKWYSSKAFDTYYYTVSMENGMFDLEGDLALARAVNPFLEDEGFVYEDVVIPYFHLDKIRVSIEEYKGE